MSDRLNEAIIAIKSGDKATGKRLLVEELEIDPRNELAWIWLTQVVSSDNERIKCLQGCEGCKMIWIKRQNLIF